MNPEDNHKLGNFSEEEYQEQQAREIELAWEEWQAEGKVSPFSRTKRSREDVEGALALLLFKKYPQLYFHSNEIEDILFNIPVVKKCPFDKTDIIITLQDVQSYLNEE